MTRLLSILRHCQNGGDWRPWLETAAAHIAFAAIFAALLFTAWGPR